MACVSLLSRRPHCFSWPPRPKTSLALPLSCHPTLTSPLPPSISCIQPPTGCSASDQHHHHHRQQLLLSPPTHHILPALLLDDTSGGLGLSWLTTLGTATPNTNYQSTPPSPQNLPQTTSVCFVFFPLFQPPLFFSISTPFPIPSPTTLCLPVFLPLFYP